MSTNNSSKNNGKSKSSVESLPPLPPGYDEANNRAIGKFVQGDYVSREEYDRHIALAKSTLHYFPFRECYLDLMSLEAAAVLQKIINWTDYCRNKEWGERKFQERDGFVRFTVAKLESSLRLKRNAQTRLLKELITKGYIEVKKIGIPPRRHVRLNLYKLSKDLCRKIDEKASHSKEKASKKSGQSTRFPNQHETVLNDEQETVLNGEHETVLNLMKSKYTSKENKKHSPPMADRESVSPEASTKVKGREASRSDTPSPPINGHAKVNGHSSVNGHAIPKAANRTVSAPAFGRRIAIDDEDGVSPARPGGARFTIPDNKGLLPKGKKEKSPASSFDLDCADMLYRALKAKDMLEREPSRKHPWYTEFRELRKEGKTEEEILRVLKGYIALLGHRHIAQALSAKSFRMEYTRIRLAIPRIMGADPDKDPGLDCHKHGDTGERPLPDGTTEITTYLFDDNTPTRRISIRDKKGVVRIKDYLPGWGS